jgi:hypothetical protein
MSALPQSASVAGPEQHWQKTTSVTGLAPGAGSLTHADRRGAPAPRHAAMRASPGRAQHLLVVPGLNLTEHGRSRWANRGTQHAPPSRSPSKPARQSSQAKDKGARSRYAVSQSRGTYGAGETGGTSGDSGVVRAVAAPAAGPAAVPLKSPAPRSHARLSPDCR